MDPSYPKPKRSGYNFFFSEHYATLKVVHTEGEELTISTKMGNLWGKLSEAEKQVFNRSITVTSLVWHPPKWDGTTYIKQQQLPYCL